MTVLCIVLTILLGYILPGYLFWRYNSLAYSKKGIWPNIEPGIFNIIMVFIPIFNILGNIWWLLGWPIEREHRKGQNIINKFFKIK